MEQIKKQDNKIILKAEMSDSLANAIRRYANQIPIVAIESIEISRNDSPLYDETIAHRMGLIPLKQNKKTGSLNLEVKKGGFVYSGELKGDVEVVYDKIPITLLNEGQELKVKAELRAGTGAEHAKFSPGIISYRNCFELEVDSKTAEKVKQILPNAEVKQKSGKSVFVDDKEKEIYDIIHGLAEKEGKDMQANPTKEIIMNIESFGQIKPQDIFKKSIEILKKDLEDVSKKIK